jgi:hypothetical protein
MVRFSKTDVSLNLHSLSHAIILLVGWRLASAFVIFANNLCQISFYNVCSFIVLLELELELELELHIFLILSSYGISLAGNRRRSMDQI